MGRADYRIPETSLIKEVYRAMYVNSGAENIEDIMSVADPLSWKDVKMSSLRGHIYNQHFTPLLLATQGVARFDIEFAYHNNWNLDSVIKRAYEKLQQSDESIVELIDNDRKRTDFSMKLHVGTMPDNFDADAYKTMIVKHLKYIEHLYASKADCKIDWQLVRECVSWLDEICLDINRDSNDVSFLNDVLPNAHKFESYEQPKIDYNSLIVLS